MSTARPTPLRPRSQLYLFPLPTRRTPVILFAPCMGADVLRGALGRQFGYKATGRVILRACCSYKSCYDFFSASFPASSPNLTQFANDSHIFHGFGACLLGAADCFAAASLSLSPLLLKPGECFCRHWRGKTLLTPCRQVCAVTQSWEGSAFDLTCGFNSCRCSTFSGCMFAALV